MKNLGIFLLDWLLFSVYFIVLQFILIFIFSLFITSAESASIGGGLAFFIVLLMAINKRFRYKFFKPFKK
jgi:hypothetical protein